MAVIINDFELLVEQPDDQVKQGADDAPPAAAGPRPTDLFDAIRFRDERDARTWAH